MDVAADAPVGPRDRLGGRHVKPPSLVVYDRIDGIKVQPQAGHGARRRRRSSRSSSSSSRPLASHNGPDGKPDTADDLDLGLGRRDVVVEEYTATFGDDDMQFVGALDAQRAVHAERRRAESASAAGNRNNVGDVWVVAELIDAGAGDGEADPGARASAGDGSALHELVRYRRQADDPAWRRGEHHRFEAAGKPFVYLVPSAAIFALDEAADDSPAPARRNGRARARSSSTRAGGHGTRNGRSDDTIAELARVRAIGELDRPGAAPAAAEDPPADAVPADDDGAQRHQPVQPELHLLLRVRRGQDRRHRERQEAEVHERGDRAPERGLHAQGGGRQQGGAPHLLRRRDAAQLPGAEERRSPTRGSAAPSSARKSTSASPPTRTLLKPDIIEFLAENHVGVTISIDGPKEVQNKFRVFHNGTGSYDVVAPKIKELLTRHRRGRSARGSRSPAARSTSSASTGT